MLHLYILSKWIKVLYLVIFSHFETKLHRTYANLVNNNFSDYVYIYICMDNIWATKEKEKRGDGT